jgi:hypothetical protein
MKKPLPVLLRAVLSAAAALVALATLSSCMAPPPVSSAEQIGASRAYAPAAAKLGTGWGEERDSHVKAGSFERASSRPDGVGQLHYTNASQPPYGSKFRGMREVIPGKVSVGLKDSSGSWLSGMYVDGMISQEKILAKEGERYEIVVKNLTRQRVEVIVSVDGLDVMDGRSAGYSKRGHIIGPRASVTIPGWRTSMGSVAAFRFAAVQDSYAERKYGESRNVGVIGVATFSEKQPPMRVFAQPPPLDKREPNPFPGERWATPPRS